MPKGGEGDARAFYGVAPGLTEAPKPDALKNNGGVWFESGALRVHLGVEEDFHPARKAHPAFMVDDLSGLRTRLTDLGCNVIDAAPLDVLVRCHVFDPFGNRIELMEKARMEAAATDEESLKWGTNQ